MESEEYQLIVSFLHSIKYIATIDITHRIRKHKTISIKQVREYVINAIWQV